MPSPSNPDFVPNVLVVSRRSLRKNKHIDYVAEFHLDLLTRFNALPIILPRVSNIVPLLHALPPIHGLLLAEGEDVGPDHHPRPPSPSLQTALAEQHPSDANPDSPKDSIETTLVRHCLRHHIPVLAICRGSQLLNLCEGGEIYHDLSTNLGTRITHINYDDYDAHRHPLSLLPNTPLARWFHPHSTISVNSYHHQGISLLAPRFRPMAHAPDGLVEAFYDPNCYDLSQGRFLVGIQFHPERMQDIQAALTHPEAPVFDYPGCTHSYRDFVIAASAFARHHASSPVSSPVPRPLPHPLPRPNRNRVWSRDELNRLSRSGATVHGASLVRSMLDLSPDDMSSAAATANVVVDHPRMRRRLAQIQRLRHVKKNLWRLTRDVDIARADQLIESLAMLIPDDTAPSSPVPADSVSVPSPVNVQ